MPLARRRTRLHPLPGGVRAGGIHAGMVCARLAAPSRSSRPYWSGSLIYCTSLQSHNTSPWPALVQPQSLPRKQPGGGNHTPANNGNLAQGYQIATGTTAPGSPEGWPAKSQPEASGRPCSTLRSSASASGVADLPGSLPRQAPGHWARPQLGPLGSQPQGRPPYFSGKQRSFLSV